MLIIMEIRIDRIRPRDRIMAAKQEAARRLPAQITKNAQTAQKSSMRIGCKEIRAEGNRCRIILYLMMHFKTIHMHWDFLLTKKFNWIIAQYFSSVNREKSKIFKNIYTTVFN